MQVRDIIYFKVLLEVIMMKKIVCVLGSPRSQGNSETLAHHFLETARSIGAEYEVFPLANLNYKGCIACMGCKTIAEECVLNDDLKQVLEAMRDADVFVLTSPIYFGEISGQAKCFFDRTYSFLKPDYMSNPQPSRLASGKKSLFILTQGHPDPAYFDIFPNYSRFLKWFGYEDYVFRATGLQSRDAVSERKDLLDEIENLAKEILQ